MHISKLHVLNCLLLYVLVFVLWHVTAEVVYVSVLVSGNGSCATLWLSSALLHRELL